MLSDTTFGDSDAAISLARMVNEINDPKISAKVATFFMHEFHMINLIANSITDQRVRRYIFICLRDKFLRHNSIKLQLPEKVKTHMQNVMAARLRDVLYN